MKVLFLDSENFKYKAREAMQELGRSEPDWSKYNFSGLFQRILGNIEIGDKRFYFARLKIHKDTKEKSEMLVTEQRALLLNIRNHGFTTYPSGIVRGRYGKNEMNGKSVLVFKEKGVDVSMAVDMVLGACDRKFQEIYLCSSDSDLQPAIKAVRSKGIRVVYVGFQVSPNMGLQRTTNSSILIRNSEIIEFITGSSQGNENPRN